MKKQLHGLLIVLAMTLTLLPMAACAANSSTSSNSSSSGNTSSSSSSNSSSNAEVRQAAPTGTLGADDAEAAAAEMQALYGENKKITDDNYDKSLAVKCVNGTFVGKEADGVVAYKGIPYVGEQPVGEQRWKAPTDVTPDDGVYEAYYFGRIPCQDADPSQKGSLYPQGEDCLHLNVWKAKEEGAQKKPVLVWIHGGAYEIGSTAEPTEEGTNFVAENPDVILVSVEYRLNALGFLHLSHLPDGAEYQDAQNLGLMDQLAALKWIHENIEGFGGDPGDVTIFGQSAGGGSVSLLPLVEGSHQYFQRIIAQSGSPAFSRSTEQAIECTDKIMKELGCTTVADLTKIDVDKIVAVASDVAGMPLTAPERDGTFLPLDPFAAYESGAAKDIEIMQGCTKDEMNYFLAGFGIETFMQWAGGLKEGKLAQCTDEERALAESFCKEQQGKDYEVLSRFLGQYWFNAPLMRTAECQVKGGGKTYVYYFRAESSLPLMGSAHSIELPEVFDHPEQVIVTGREIDETFSKTMRKMWVQFAKTGNPSLSADISPDGKAKEWPLYDPKDRQVMVFDEDDIRAEKESDLGIVDWDKSYFLAKYYV